MGAVACSATETKPPTLGSFMIRIGNHTMQTEIWHHPLNFSGGCRSEAADFGDGVEIFRKGGQVEKHLAADRQDHDGEKQA